MYQFHVQCIDQVNLNNGPYSNDTRGTICSYVSLRTNNAIVCWHHAYSRKALFSNFAVGHTRRNSLSYVMILAFFYYFSKPRNSITKNNQTTANTTTKKRAPVIYIKQSVDPHFKQYRYGDSLKIMRLQGTITRAYYKHLEHCIVLV